MRKRFSRPRVLFSSYLDANHTQETEPNHKGKVMIIIIIIIVKRKEISKKGWRWSNCNTAEC